MLVINVFSCHNIPDDWFDKYVRATRDEGYSENETSMLDVTYNTVCIVFRYREFYVRCGMFYASAQVFDTQDTKPALRLPDIKHAISWGDDL